VPFKRQKEKKRNDSKKEKYTNDSRGKPLLRKPGKQSL
jgi:hypothetical protein